MIKGRRKLFPTTKLKPQGSCNKILIPKHQTEPKIEKQS